MPEKVKQKSGFARNPQLASEVGKMVKSRQSPEERSERSRKAAIARWEHAKRDGLKYEDIKDLNPGQN